MWPSSSSLKLEWMDRCLLQGPEVLRLDVAQGQQSSGQLCVVSLQSRLESIYFVADDQQEGAVFLQKKDISPVF